MNKTTHAVGIDLGTTYSCIAYLNEHGEPVTLANQEGEFSTPSVVLFDGDETIVGTEALRNAILQPKNVIQNSKRFVGSSDRRWLINDKPYTPVDIAALILKKLISSAQDQIGPIDQAVITVPAQFNDAQRHATIEAGHRAGLQRIDLINEPVAAALCYVLGSEGLWFSELAQRQNILVYDLGGGTFDLSLVRYDKNEVKVIASSGDLKLGGIDWNHALLESICSQFKQEFGTDPRSDAESLQLLSWEVEQTKRSLTTRPNASLTCQHGGHRKVYRVRVEDFEKLTQRLVQRTSSITQKLLKDRKLGWAHIDVVLTTGGATRMPAVRRVLKKISGRTQNAALSPDLSIAHGATYYAGMLLSNENFAHSILSDAATSRLSKIRQQSVSARDLGIIVRDTEKQKRIPHYLIQANTPLPSSATQIVGTIMPNQKRVRLQVVESGAGDSTQPTLIGACMIKKLPENLPEGSEISVTIKYDEQARVQVTARDMASGRQAYAEIIRQENLVPQLSADLDHAAHPGPESDVAFVLQPQTQSIQKSKSKNSLESTDEPVVLCNKCGEPVNPLTRHCRSCGPIEQTASRSKKTEPAPRRKKSTSAKKRAKTNRDKQQNTQEPVNEVQGKRPPLSEIGSNVELEPVTDDFENFWQKVDTKNGTGKEKTQASKTSKRKKQSQQSSTSKKPKELDGENEFFGES